MSEITIRRVLLGDKAEWLRMRLLLWTDASPDKHLAEMDEIMQDPMQPVFVAVRENGKLGGFLEAGTRDYAEGCETSPVGYIEGWYMDKDLRGQGVGRALMEAAENWAREQGLTEMASDTWLDNEVSIQAHLKLGYAEVERAVHFAKKLD
jgi:aminoglycoside 6'-N-acetyltransferase I